jgi:membrane protein implicated in regulation of membrane protease activity
MFGFSFWKLLLLVAVIAVAWFGWRWYQRWELEQQRRGDEARRTGGTAAPRLAAEDMVACRVCGIYVAPKSARACSRPECPYPR